MFQTSVYSVSAIILKRRNWGEADKILTVFTLETGKIRVIAKGVRKINSRRSGYLEPFRMVKLTLHKGSKLDYVTEVSSQHETMDMKLSQLGYEYFICEIIDKLTPEAEKHEDLYFLLKNSITRISHALNQADLSVLFCEFANTLLSRLGYLDENISLNQDEITPYIERIIEKRLKSPKIISRFSGNV
jgi:DNA repair protein RecO (recombination protein O)